MPENNEVLISRLELQIGEQDYQLLKYKTKKIELTAEIKEIEKSEKKAVDKKVSLQVELNKLTSNSFETKESEN